MNDKDEASRRVFPLISLLFVYFEHFLSRKPGNGIKTWEGVWDNQEIRNPEPEPEP